MENYINRKNFKYLSIKLAVLKINKSIISFTFSFAHILYIKKERLRV